MAKCATLPTASARTLDIYEINIHKDYLVTAVPALSICSVPLPTLATCRACHSCRIVGCTVFDDMSMPGAAKREYRPKYLPALHVEIPLRKNSLTAWATTAPPCMSLSLRLMANQINSSSLNLFREPFY